MNCTETCPKNLNPAESIFNLKKMVKFNLLNNQSAIIKNKSNSNSSTINRIITNSSVEMNQVDVTKLYHQTVIRIEQLKAETFDYFNHPKEDFIKYYMEQAKKNSSIF